MKNADELTMRTLCGDDVFTMAKIISMTDISKLENAVSGTGGGTVWLDIVYIICSGLDKCRDVIVGFLASLYSVSEEDIRALAPSEFVRLIKKTAASEGFRDFFTAVSELLIWA